MDADSLMRPKDGPYKFHLVPQFWEFIAAKAEEGVIASTSLVYGEICNSYDNDPLRIWAEERPGPPLFREPTDAVYACFKEVADYVDANYRPEWAQAWLKKADPWLIAHAKAEGGTVVTFEVLVGRGAKEVKIPNVCRALKLADPINTWEMLDALGARFG
jgi:hypothetical protein